MAALTSTNELSPNVAAEYGAACKQDDRGVWHIGNGVTQQDFDEALSDLIACGAKPMLSARNAAYIKLQSEGYEK